MNVNHKLKLTVAKVRSAESGRHQDGNGLMLNVKPSGSRQWIQRIVIQGKRVDIGLGGFPLVTLAEAREQAFQNRRIARAGGDPRAKQSVAPAFADATRKVHAIHAPAIKNATDRAKWINDMINHAFPTLGNRPVDQITTSEVMAVILPLWHDKPTVAKRVKQRLSLVMQWAIVEGYRIDNPAGDALNAVLPRNGNGNGNGNGTKHMQALPYKDVASAITAVRDSAKHDSAKLAFEFLVLTAVRSHEVRGAQWSEIDMDARTWTIPAERMKAGKEHRVPLSDSAMKVLEKARELLHTTTVNKRSELVFPNRGKPVDEKVMPRMMKELRINAVPHGFRSSFRDWCAEYAKVAREVAEAALAHVVSNKIEAAYARSDLFQRRAELMQQWADYLTERSS